jgi:EPS-associated MarR family transcriptional regulator
MPVLTDESRYRILRLIEENPTISQREIAHAMGISLGKVNFCLNALIKIGILKANSFLNSRNKRAYSYVFTPSGIEEKARVTVRFLKLKMEEYEVLQGEILELKNRARQLGVDESRMKLTAEAPGGSESSKRSG